MKIHINSDKRDKTAMLFKHYDATDFVIQQKVKFAFYLSFSLVIAMVITFLFIVYLQLIKYGAFNYPVLLSIIACLLIFVGCIFLLFRGYYTFATNLILFSSMLTVWASMLFDKGDIFGKLDTIAYIFPVLAMVPLFIQRNSIIIFIYSVINVIFLYLFVFVVNANTAMAQNPGVISDYLIDTTISLLFISLISYSIFRINKNALDRAQLDIQERKEVEKALVKSEQKFREMTDLLPQIIFEANAQGQLTYVNKSAYDIFGYSESDLQSGVHILQTVAKEDHVKVTENISKLAQGGISTGHQYNAIKKDGTTFPVQIYSSIIVEDGKYCGLRGIIIDISERVKSEMALKQSEALFKTLIDASPIAIVLNDINGNYLMVNKEFTKETTLVLNDVVGKKNSELGLIINPNSEAIINKEIQQNGYVDNIETTLTINSTKQIDLYFSSRIIELNNQPAILSSIINITEKKKIERELEKYRNQLEIMVNERTNDLAEANEELSVMNKELSDERSKLEKTLADLQATQKQLVQTEKMASLGVLAAGIAHEINNPLNYINSGIIAVETYFSNEIPSEHLNNLQPVLNAIHNGVHKTTEIVKSLNRFSRQTDATNEDCYIHLIIDNCLVILNTQIKDKIEIDKQFTTKPFIIQGNEGKLHQAILNILTNAIQSIVNSGVITISTNISDDDILTLTIEDNGEGIQKENISKIFDPFFTTKPPGQGTGLGMSITYQIINDMNGTIEYHSEIGKGTIVKTMIPIKKQNNSQTNIVL